MRYHHTKQTGFTLIETLAALVVLSVALIPAVTLSKIIFNVSNSIKNNLIASNLAQEGVEIIKTIRDNNWIAGSAFDNGLTCGSSSCDYRVEWWNTTTPLLSLGTNPPLKKDPATGLYNYTTGTDQIFKRKVTVTAVSANQLRVVSEVSWPERARTVSGCPVGLRCIKVEGHLFNWR